MYIKDVKPGDIIKGSGQVGIIRDVYHSRHTGRWIICVTFAHNIGNARTYDMLEVNDDIGELWGIPDWELVKKSQLNDALNKRKRYLENLIDSVYDEAKDL